MKYTKRLSIEGRDNIITVGVMIVIVVCIVFFLDFSVIWKVVCVVSMLGVSIYALRDAIAHLGSDKAFLCELTKAEFIQECPIYSRGESFRIKLSEITKIELEHRHNNPRWYIHAKRERYWITASYQNIDRKFGEELLRRLPHVTAFNS